MKIVLLVTLYLVMVGKYTATLASSSEFREKLEKKRRNLQETLGGNKKDDLQALVSDKPSVRKRQTAMKDTEDSEEDSGETLKRTLRAQRQRRRRKLLEQSSVKESQHGDEDEEEISHVQDQSVNEEPAEKTVVLRPPSGSRRGYSLKPLPVSSSQKLDTFVTRHLEEKLRAARTKGESLQQEKEVSADPGSRLQSLRGRDRATRFDRETDSVKEEEDDVSVALSARVKFKDVAKRVNQGLPTANEAYNFFTFNFEPEPPEETEEFSRKKRKQKETSEKDRDEDEGEEPEEEDKEDSQDHNENQSEETRLVPNEEDLFIIDQSPQDFLEVKKAEYVGVKKRAERDSELLFTPSFRKAPTSVKLPENHS
ncbi:hypothetical protein OJAV_G00037800 [Oryzias javanicus]|uniref:DUF5523 domain-containing protein n=1 Tax=Oryzias javanicus TaxID=123683 RepID=A0A3S2MTQ4_ORYJA|nr:hypothetical protein OJAV_G00037800 [Oryzias javanicus]